MSEPTSSTKRERTVEDEKDCPVCLESFDNSTEKLLGFLSKCGHRLCAECYDQIKKGPKIG